MTTQQSLDAALRWITGEIRKHIFDDKEYLKMLSDYTFRESYKSDITTIRQTLKKENTL